MFLRSKQLFLSIFIQGYPFKKEAIINEAGIDIPPYCRGNVWAALLGIVGDIQRSYEIIDKETPNSTDRQVI